MVNKINNRKKKYNIKKNILNNDDEMSNELEEITNDIEEIDNEFKDIDNEKDKNLDKTIETNSNYGYPKIDDPNLQAKIYAKREFYYYKLPDRPDLSNYKEIEEYRKKICVPPSGTLLEHQSLLSNFINPDTPYKGLLIFHGTGTGKCKRGSDYEYVNGNLIKAQDVWNKYSSKIVIENINNTYGEWSIPLENLNINCYDNNKIIIKPIKRLYREYINSRIREITFENGSKIGITFDHKLYTQNGWTNNLEINDEIAIPRVIYNTSKINYYTTNETYNLGLNYTNKFNSIENKILHMNKENIKSYLSGVIEKKAFINKNNK